MFEINGKTAIVTGGAGGIGLATVKMLLEKGANVVMADFNEKTLEEQYSALNEIYGDKVAKKLVNVTVEEQVKELVEYAVEKYGELDIMVNNAGTGGLSKKIYDPIDECMPDFKNVLNINLNGVLYGGKYAADQMIKQGKGGAIVSTSSIMGHVSNYGCTGYSASKHGVLGFTKAWALELAPFNIRVNALCPGFVTTGLVNDDIVDAEGMAYIKSLHPLSAALDRIGNPDEQAHAIIFMIENTFMTGQSVVVDGGYVIR